MDKTIQTIKTFFCDDCEGWGVVGQSPYNPGGDPCQACESTGFAHDGSTARDLLSQVEKNLKEQ